VSKCLFADPSITLNNPKNTVITVAELTDLATINTTKPAKPSIQSAEVLLVKSQSLMAHGKTYEDLIGQEDILALMGMMDDNPKIASLVLQHFTKAAGTDFGKLLGITLARRPTPETINTLTGLLRNGTRQQHIGVMWVMQGNANYDTVEAITLILAIVQADNGMDTQLNLTALNTFNPYSTPPEIDKQLIIDTIITLAHAEDPQVRMLSLETLEKWADKPTLLDTYLQAANDPEQHVRVTAVSLLNSDKIAYADVRDFLLAKLQDSNEDFGVRDTANNVLLSFALDPQAKKISQAFTDKHYSKGGWHQTIVRDY
jgi:HEAT repeats